MSDLLALACSDRGSTMSDGIACTHTHRQHSVDGIAYTNVGSIMLDLVFTYKATVLEFYALICTCELRT